MPSKLTDIDEIQDDFASDVTVEKDKDDDDFEAGEIEGFDGGCDAASFGEFDPMQALGQLLVTHEGETIPDVLVGIKNSIDTLTKVLHKIGKTLEKK